MTHNASRPRKVLIADAEEGPRRQAAHWLWDQGYATEEVAGGRPALQDLLQGQTSVALLDADLPDLSGLEVLREAYRAGTIIPVIMGTSSGNVHRAVQAMKAGAWDYLTRPYQKHELLAALASALEGAGSAAAPWGWRAARDCEHSRKMELLGRITGGVVHDFNNTLTRLLGFGQYLKGSLGPGHALLAQVQHLLSAAEHGKDLTLQLTAFMQNRPILPCDFDLNLVVRKMHAMLARLLGDQVEIRLRLDSNAAYIRADPCQIEQVIMNLALNARDAMPDGGGLVFETASRELVEHVANLPADSLSIASVPPGNYVVLSVVDTGTGMNEETKSRLFEPFYTTKADRGGIGLGLSNVHRIVLASGGHIAVKSEVGHGTTFSIFWPRSNAEQPFAAAVPDSVAGIS